MISQTRWLTGLVATTAAAVATLVYLRRRNLIDGKSGEVVARKHPIRVLVTGAAGQIGYALVPLIANGDMFGKDQPVVLHMLDIAPCKEKLLGMKLELEDAIYPLLKGIVATVDLQEAFTDVEVAILVGGFPRLKGMERKQLLEKNNPIFVAQGKALSDFASKNCKVLVVANPANTNCYTAQRHCPKLPKENFTCLTRLDMNRAKAQIGMRLHLDPQALKNIIIWGNHSSTQVPDISHAHYESPAGRQAFKDKLEEKWLRETFVPVVQQRGKAVIDLRGASSAFSASQAICDHIRSWLVTGTKDGEYVSMGVVSDGSYDITPNIVYSYPVTCRPGHYQIVKGLPLDDYTKAMMKRSEEELCEERDEAVALLAA